MQFIVVLYDKRVAKLSAFYCLYISYFINEIYENTGSKFITPKSPIYLTAPLGKQWAGLLNCILVIKAFYITLLLIYPLCRGFEIVGLDYFYIFRLLYTFKDGFWKT